mmetsp:Transcript_4258/g.8940  ORF Transcript_4258/g.8940 Transcript_4258/m.8940 type:complete len:138 (-) Transcript_4258:740-1153(-)
MGSGLGISLPNPVLRLPNSFESLLRNLASDLVDIDDDCWDALKLFLFLDPLRVRCLFLAFDSPLSLLSLDVELLRCLGLELLRSLAGLEELLRLGRELERSLLGLLASLAIREVLGRRFFRRELLGLDGLIVGCGGA